MGNDIVKDILEDHSHAFECIYTEFFKRLPSATKEWPSIYKEQEALSRLIKVLNKIKKDGNDSLFGQLTQPGSSFSVFQNLSTEEILERLEYMKAVRVNPMHSKSIWPKDDKNIPRRLLIFGLKKYLDPIFKDHKDKVSSWKKYGETNITEDNKYEVIRQYLLSKDIQATSTDAIRKVLDNLADPLANDPQLSTLLEIAYSSAIENIMHQD